MFWNLNRVSKVVSRTRDVRASCRSINSFIQLHYFERNRYEHPSKHPERALR